MRDPGPHTIDMAPLGCLAVPLSTAVAATAKPTRIFGLDFTKGTLVLIMVLYHWISYFLPVDDFTFRYLRFLTPSFIFITGFLVARVYLPKHDRGDATVPRRVAWRGVKLILLAMSLNVPLQVLGVLRTRVSSQTATEFVVSFFTGRYPLAFSILVPIGYVLLSSAAVILVRKVYAPAFHILTAALLVL